MTVGSSALPVAPVEFFVMAGCGDPSPPAPCSDELYRFSDNLSVVDDSTEVTTNLGIFKDPFELNYGGGIVTSSSALAVDVIGDIRDICGSSSDTINHGDTAGIGKLYIMPEIGIIQMQNTCTVTGINTKTVYYSVTLDNTNIPTPW